MKITSEQAERMYKLVAELRMVLFEILSQNATTETKESVKNEILSLLKNQL